MRLIFWKPPTGGAPKDVSRMNPDEERIGRTTERQNTEQKIPKEASWGICFSFAESLLVRVTNPRVLGRGWKLWGRIYFPMEIRGQFFGKC